MSTGRRILALDDSAIVLEMYRLLLSPRHTLVVAASGQEAMEKLERDARIDLILLEVNMPQTNGFLFLEQLRSDPRHAWIPVLVVSSLNGEQDARRALALGAIGYMAKPFRPADLLRLVERTLDGRPQQAPAPAHWSFQQPASGFRRVPCHQPCDVVVGKERDQAVVWNLSVKGAYVAIAAPLLSVGEAVHLTFSLPGDVWPITCDARVAWVNPSSTPEGRGARAPGLPAGCGLEFAHINPRDAERIDARVRTASPERMR